jgi:hypothetical protein
MVFGRRIWLPLAISVITLLEGCGTGSSSSSAAASSSVSPSLAGTPAQSSSEPKASAPANPSDLAQPLHLPTLALGAPCPHSAMRVMSAALPPALGPGPAMPTGQFVNGVLTTSALGALLTAHLVWVVAPSYQGPVLVRGRQLSGTGTVRFGTGSAPSAGQLRLPAAGGTTVPGAPGWRTWAIVISVPRPGCYGFQVDGVGFSTVILFEAI